MLFISGYNPCIGTKKFKYYYVILFVERSTSKDEQAILTCGRPRNAGFKLNQASILKNYIFTTKQKKHPKCF